MHFLRKRPKLAAYGFAFATLFNPVVSGDEQSGGDCETSYPSAEQIERLFLTNDVNALVLGAVFAGVEVLEEFSELPEALYLEKAKRLNAENGLLLQTLADACYFQRRSTKIQEICKDDPLPQLVRISPQNGFYYLENAISQHRKGNANNALNFIQDAVGRPEMNDNYIEQMAEFAQVVETHLPESRQCAFGFAAQAAAFNLPSYASIFLMCDAQTTNNEDWLRACLSLGEAMEKKGRNLITVKIGLSLQKKYYPILDSTHSMTPVLDRIAEFDALLKQYSALISELETDTSFEREWLNTALEHGEVETMKMMIRTHSSSRADELQ